MDAHYIEILLNKGIYPMLKTSRYSHPLSNALKKQREGPLS